ncbi:MAG: alkaline phosphatase D family protein [Bacteroidales bacterium]|jgi:alkaline phosphatase D|nr:alkaline phosphatase D family protein [Bacteroidales bacterium]
MKRKIPKQLPAIIAIIITLSACNKQEVSYTSSWEYQPDRIWSGPEFWANRLQDWEIEEGELRCVNSTHGLRTVHLLTHQVNEDYGELHINLQLSINPNARRTGNEGWAGILLGAGEGLIDYRGAALIHHSPGKTGGIIVAVNEVGQVVFLDNTENREHIGTMQALPDVSYPDSLILNIEVYPDDDSLYTITANAIDPLTRNVFSHNNLTRIPQHRIRGNIALAANHLEIGFWDYTYSFKKLEVFGTNLNVYPKQRFGPFMGVMHTLSDNTLKLTVQLPPIGDNDDQFVRMSYKEKGDITWIEVDSSIIRNDAFIAPFRIEEWNSALDHDYRLSYRLSDEKGRKRSYYYSGIIKADPVQKPELVVGAFACMSHMEGSINGRRIDYPDRLWFPHSKFVQSVEEQKADILFFMGDQIYEGRPTPPDFSSPENTELDYLYKWYIFLWSTGELMRNTPTICMLDDHDVYHGNIWGDNGKAAPAYPADSTYPIHYEGFQSHWQQDQGGYKLRASSVNMIQATQTSHLPDPYDPTPVEQGIEVYYTDLNYGRISFAILEDRKFKSAPSLMLLEAHVVNGFSQNRYVSGRKLDNPDAKLLGDRQIEFLENWSADWKNADMKASISQTIFANLSTYPDTFKTDAGTPSLIAPPAGVIPERYRVAKDMDSNGWPQTGRNKALKSIRKGYAVMIAGDQHLGSLIHMGTDTWDDAGYSFCVPAIGNLWPRRWFPPLPGLDHEEGMPSYTGKYFDGFGNRMNVYAAANPVETNKEPRALYNRAVGYGIIKFNKPTGEIKFECWRRDANPDLGEQDMFPGWPKTISIFDNYNRPIRTWLPNYKVIGLDNNPVFKVTNETSGEILYTVRIPGNSYQPGVFTYGGDYTVSIGDPDSETYQVFEHVKARYTKPEEEVIVQF